MSGCIHAGTHHCAVAYLQGHITVRSGQKHVKKARCGCAQCFSTGGGLILGDTLVDRYMGTVEEGDTHVQLRSIHSKQECN